MKSNNALYILGGVVVIGLLMWALGSQSSPKSTLENPSATSTKQEERIVLGEYVTNALYVCDNKKAIGADFYKQGVILKLSDQRIMTLPQTISASGVRFSNKDESFVFWNKGNTAFIDEAGTRTFENCVEAKPEFE